MLRSALIATHPIDVRAHMACVIFQVTELCTGGELFDRIIAKTESAEGHYSETDAANIVHKILGYVHDLPAATLQPNSGHNS